jgi:chromosome segregation ATPase
MISKNEKEMFEQEIDKLKKEKHDLIKKYFEMKNENAKLKKERKELINTINEYSREAMEREERELMEYLSEDEERFNDYSFMDMED